MGNDQSSRASRIQYVHEAAFSLNLAFVTMCLVFVYASDFVIVRLNQLEFSVDKLVHIRQTDFIRGYWEFFLPGLALALCIWTLLRLSSGAQSTRKVILWVGGVAALVAAPACWFCMTYSASRRYGWNPFHEIQLYEVALVLMWALLYLRGRWLVPLWGNLLTILLHCGFWLWQFRPQLLALFTGYGSSAAVTWIAGLGASLAWVLYVREPSNVSLTSS
jgi:hypothetical protein